MRAVVGTWAGATHQAAALVPAPGTEPEQQWRVPPQFRFVRTPFGLGGYEALIGASIPWTAALIWS